MFKWEERHTPWSTSYVFGSDQFPMFVHVGKWMNKGDNYGNWSVKVTGNIFFFDGDYSIKEIKGIAEKQAIIVLTKAIFQISTL